MKQIDSDPATISASLPAQALVKVSERDRAISTLNIVAMLSVILIHLMPLYNLKEWVYFANTGVALFFLISGYLYGQKNISKWGAFYIKRWKTLMIPIYIGIVTTLLFLSPFRFTKYSFNQYLTHFLNLSGVTWMDASPNHDMYSLLTLNGRIEYIHDFLHLWFMTYLMIALFLIPLIQFLRNKFSPTKAWLGGWLPVAFASLILLVLTFTGFNLWYIGTFMIGYCVNTNIIPRNWKGVRLSAILVVGCYIVLYSISGYQTNFGNLFCASYIALQSVIAICMFGITQFIFRAFPNIKGFDVGNLTYFIYITHFPCLIIFHRLLVYPLIALVLYSIATLLTGLGLQFADKFIQRIMWRN